jgi:hypothetical protein
MKSLYSCLTAIGQVLLWALEEFKKAAAAWMKQNPQRKITRYQMGRLIGVAWNRAASVGVGASAFESTGIYPLNFNRVPEHFFSISDTS